RAGGVVDRDRFFLVLEPAGWPCRRGIGQELLVGVIRAAGVRTPDNGYASEIERGCQRLQVVVDEEEAGAAVLDDVADLRAGEAVVDRDQDAARGRHAEVRLEHRR